MKKLFTGIIITFAIGALVVILLCGIGCGIGKGIGNEKGDGNANVQTNQEDVSIVENDIIIEEKKEEQIKNAKDVRERTILKINVVGNDYFYENERVTLDTFFAKVQETEGMLDVEVKDDNASLNAYNNLIEQLEKKNIYYVEK